MLPPCLLAFDGFKRTGSRSEFDSILIAWRWRVARGWLSLLEVFSLLCSSTLTNSFTLGSYFRVWLLAGPSTIADTTVEVMALLECCYIARVVVVVATCGGIDGVRSIRTSSLFRFPSSTPLVGEAHVLSLLTSMSTWTLTFGDRISFPLLLEPLAKDVYHTCCCNTRIVAHIHHCRSIRIFHLHPCS